VPVPRIAGDDLVRLAHYFVEGTLAVQGRCDSVLGGVQPVLETLGLIGREQGCVAGKQKIPVAADLVQRRRHADIVQVRRQQKERDLIG
jgi:hypothetical protein